MSKRNIRYMTECSDDFLTSITSIIGASSAASQALAERDRRQALGENVAVFWDRDNGLLLVGPTPLQIGKERPE